ncbi:MAG: hypothetical protein E4H13_10095 [Calditrichales bacterium]|nr:MAG: hypothetical protein E4H13_10095 [Calditrichales bacterium]
MVLVLVLLTIGIFFLVDHVLRKEERQLRVIENEKKSPIFLSPEKSLTPLSHVEQRMYHLSHSWVQPGENHQMYIGFDDFISRIFSEDVVVDDLPVQGSHIPQGVKIWDVGLDSHRITQLSPVSGKVIAVNPALKLRVPVSARDVMKSWVIQVQPDNFPLEKQNLMNHSQSQMINTALSDELHMTVQAERFLNDGGKIDPDFLEKLPEKDWNRSLDTFFPYQKALK